MLMNSKYLSCQLLKKRDLRRQKSVIIKLYVTPDEDYLFDPFQKNNGWQANREGVHRWPAIIISDITIYLRPKDTDIRDRVLKDYKEGKAYSYLQSNLIGEIFYHPL